MTLFIESLVTQYAEVAALHELLRESSIRAPHYCNLVHVVEHGSRVEAHY